MSLQFLQMCFILLHFFYCFFTKSGYSIAKISVSSKYTETKNQCLLLYSRFWADISLYSKGKFNFPPRRRPFVYLQGFRVFQGWLAEVTHGAKNGGSFSEMMGPSISNQPKVNIWIVYFTYTLTQTLVCIYVY